MMVRIQNRNYSNTEVSLPSGFYKTNREGMLECPQSDAERLLATPGWSRPGEAPIRHAIVNPHGGQVAPNAPRATLISDPLADAVALADRLKALGQGGDPLVPVVAPPATDAPATGPEGTPTASMRPLAAAPGTESTEAPPPPSTTTETTTESQPASIDDLVKAGQAKGINVPKIVRAEGDAAVRTYLEAALAKK